MLLLRSMSVSQRPTQKPLFCNSVITSRTTGTRAGGDPFNLCSQSRSFFIKERRFRMPCLLSAAKTSLLKVRASSGEAKSEAAQEEVFSWSSVILPFVFPALGGLLFGYDIGATSGATISLQSPELNGTTWFNLSAVQLGLVVSGSLCGALLGEIIGYPLADSLEGGENLSLHLVC